MTWQYPGTAIAVALVLVPLWLWAAAAVTRGRRICLNLEHRFGHNGWPDDTRRSWRERTFWIPGVLRWSGLACLLAAVGAPHDWHDLGLVDVEGVAIELVIDRSGSMMNDDYVLDDRRVTRLDAVTDAASRFILGDPSRSARAHDTIGLIMFARYADRVCVPTLDHEQVVARLGRIDAAVDYREDGTAIGEALALAVADLESLQESLQEKRVERDLSRVVVLLTDGQNNAGEISPEEATALAVQLDVKIHVIGLEPASLRSETARQRVRSERTKLAAMADATGGVFFPVGNAEGLQEVYAAIDRLERTNVGQQPHRVRHHWSVSWFRIGSDAYPPLLGIAFASLVLASLLRRSLYLSPRAT